MDRALWNPKDLEDLIKVLKEMGHEVVGPTVRDQAIIYDQIQSIADLPQGITEKQAPGRYELKDRSDPAYFGYVVGPHSWKNFLTPSKDTLWTASKEASGISVEKAPLPAQKVAYLGVRSCDLKAIDILDRVYLKNGFEDERYKARRENIFVVAVNCVESGDHCFCVSMNTGPKAKSGFDISLTELVKNDEHSFIVESGSPRGAEIVGRVNANKASDEQIKQAELEIENCAKNMGRSLDTKNIREKLFNNLNHKIWDEIADQCLSCANCTMVCPTCFCSTVEDHTDLKGEKVEHVKKWDSCFNESHSHLNGGPVHKSTPSRYRQWLTHKLGSWQEQYGVSGCVGCGRCVTWCPVGIDFTEEIKKLDEVSS